MQWVKDVGSFYNFIGYVVLRAPNRFPVEDFLEPDEQMNLVKAFQELRRGIEIAGHLGMPAEQMLEASFDAYTAGDHKNGAHLLQDMEKLIFKK